MGRRNLRRQMEASEERCSCGRGFDINTNRVTDLRRLPPWGLPADRMQVSMPRHWQNPGLTGRYGKNATVLPRFAPGRGRSIRNRIIMPEMDMRLNCGFPRCNRMERDCAGLSWPCETKLRLSVVPKARGVGFCCSRSFGLRASDTICRSLNRVVRPLFGG